jgi:hypothetical protein
MKYYCRIISVFLGMNVPDQEIDDEIGYGEEFG